MKKVILYTDGACSGNPGVGGWGAVLIYGEHEKQISGAVADTTNNRMEVLAVINGLECLKEPCEVTVYSDSAYMVNAVNCGWLSSWKEGDWKKADKKPVLNSDLWQRLCKLAERHNITFVKVKGHADNRYNNLCDKLATSAIKNFRAVGGQGDGGGE